jgi:hypothetical protein
MDVLKEVLEFLVAISWPIVVLIIALMFRADLGALIPRLKRAGPSGIEFDAAEQRKQAAEISQSNPAELKKIPGVQRTAASVGVEQKLREAINKIEQSERFDVVLAELASSRLETHFALTYNIIFGSQIRALRLLNERNGVVPVSEAHAYFEEVKANHGEFSDWTFEQYSNFLRVAYLIEERNNQVFLTDIGREFLFFILKYRLSEGKPL